MPRNEVEHEVEHERGRRHKECPKATIEQLLCVEFDVVFDVDVNIVEDSVRVEVVNDRDRR